MTALRAPTGGSSEGDADDASAETVSEHGESLREIAALIDQLRDKDVGLRVRSHASLPAIAAALGPRRCRDELVPFVCDLTDDADDVLLELATRLGELGPLVGGARHAHVLLAPLEALCAAEDAGVRAAAAEAACGVCLALVDETAVAEFFAPFVARLARHEWFTARAAACAVLAACRRRLEGPAAEQRAVLAALAADAAPAVRAAAARAVGDLAQACHAREGGGWWAAGGADVVEALRALAGDGQDAVRLACVAALGTVAASLDASGRARVVLPLLLDFCEDPAWRARHALAYAFAPLAQGLDAAPRLRESYAKLLGDPEAEVRAAAALHVAEAVDATRAPGDALDGLAPAVDALTRDVSANVRAALARRAADLAPALGAAAAADVVLPLLLTLLRDDEADVRLNVVSRLAPIHAVIGVDALAAALLPAIVALAADATWRVRAAVVGLAPGVCDQLGAATFDLATRNVCASWLDDPVAAVRAAAVATLAKLAPTLGAAWTVGDALPRVAAQARHESYLRRVTAMGALAALAAAPGALDAEAVADHVLPVAEAAVADAVPNVRLNAATALGAVGRRVSGAALARVRAGLDALDADADADVRDFAAAARAAIDASP